MQILEISDLDKRDSKLAKLQQDMEAYFGILWFEKIIEKPEHQKKIKPIMELYQKIMDSRQ